MVWRDKSGWQIEGIFNYGPNVLSFLLTEGLHRWYIVGAYVPPNDAPTVSRVEHALGNSPKVLEVILLDNLNVRLQESSDMQEE